MNAHVKSILNKFGMIGFDLMAWKKIQNYSFDKMVAISQEWVYT